METELTKKIKLATHLYNPKMSSKMRTVCYSDEVWTPTGIVDSIRFEDYKSKTYDFCRLIDFDSLDSETQNMYLMCGAKPHICKDGITSSFPNELCKCCVYKSHTYETDMMITCFEVKITLSDFKSKNGHNFCGNENYYCVPKELVKSIEKLVPEEIGILSYSEKSERLQKVKDSKWQDVDDDTKILLLYNAFKKRMNI